MKTFILSAGCAFFLQCTCRCQSIDSLKNIYNNLTIYHSGFKFIQGDKKLTMAELRTKFTTPELIPLYRKSIKLSTIGTLFNVASLGLAVYSSFSSNKQIVNIELAAGTGLLGIIGILFHTRATGLLDKAVWKLNRETLFNIQQ